MQELFPSAVFAASDPIAIGAMRALYQKGYRIPEDISVIGFDDINVAKFSNPPLTTIYAPADFMGQFAAHYIQLLAESNTKFSLQYACKNDPSLQTHYTRYLWTSFVDSFFWSIPNPQLMKMGD